MGIPLDLVLEVIEGFDTSVTFTDEKVFTTPSRKPAPETEKGCVHRSKMTLFDYQAEVVEASKKQRGLIVVHSVGSGKTLTANAIAECFLEEHPDRQVVVITPTSLVENFKKELKASYGNKNLAKYSFYTHAKFGLDAKKGALPKNLVKGNLVIIDEIHNYRTAVIPKYLKAYLATGDSTGLSLSYFVNEALKPAAKVVGLTATPIVNNLNDLKMIMSLVTGKNLYQTIKGKNTMDKILTEGKGLFSFYEREQHDPRFPSYTVHKIEIVMPPDYFEKYIEIEQQLTKEAKEMGEAFFSNTRAASNKIDDTLHSPKVLWSVRKIQRIIEKGGRVVVFSTFINAGINMVKLRLDELGIGNAFITGEVSKVKRTQIVQEYNNGMKPVLLISKAGGEGLDLKETTAVIMLEQTWNGAARTQVFGRGVRNGSHKNLPKELQHVDCYILLMVKPKMPPNTPERDVGKYYRLSGDKSIYMFTESKEQYTHRILSSLDTISIDDVKPVRWQPHREEYFLLPGMEDPSKGIFEKDSERIEAAMKKLIEQGEKDIEDRPTGGRKERKTAPLKKTVPPKDTGPIPNLPFDYPVNSDNNEFKRGILYVQNYLQTDSNPRITPGLREKIRRLIFATDSGFGLKQALTELMDEVDSLETGVFGKLWNKLWK